MSNGAERTQGDGVSSAAALANELAWLARVVEARFALYFENDSSDVQDIHELLPPDLDGDMSPFARKVREYSLGFDERLVLALAMAPHLRPAMLDNFMLRNKTLDRGFTEFGGKVGQSHGGFLPTFETAVFLIAGDDLARRLDALKLFESDGVLDRLGLSTASTPATGEPALSQLLALLPAALGDLTAGDLQKPDYSMNFPAKLTTSPLTRKDLVLTRSVSRQIDHVLNWMRSNDVLLTDFGLGRHIKPGYRCLFHGPPGTGKTLTATVIGQELGVDVYRIDLSMLVSKYIGETEKNLAAVFDQAQDKRWILFFDEADALFGRRTQTRDSNDRHANREIAYLLQRVEDFPGLVILATNLQGNLDDAFARRFQLAIYFPIPGVRERRALWTGAIGTSLTVDDSSSLDTLAERYELSGGAIINVVRYAAVEAIANKRHVLRADDLIEGIRKELGKEGRTA